MDWELAQTVALVIAIYMFLKMIDNMIVKRDNRADDMAHRIELLEDRVAKAGLGSGEASIEELKAIIRRREKGKESPKTRTGYIINWIKKLFRKEK